MTYEEMSDVIDAIFEAGEAGTIEAEKVLQQVPMDDVIVGELFGLFMAAVDDFEAIKQKVMRGGSGGEYDEIIAAATKVRDASLTWARYVEVVAKAPEKSTPGRFDAILARLHERGLIVDTGERRWNPQKQHHDVMWALAPGLPEDCDAGSDVANAVLNFLRERS